MISLFVLSATSAIEKHQLDSISSVSVVKGYVFFSAMGQCKSAERLPEVTAIPVSDLSDVPFALLPDDAEGSDVWINVRLFKKNASSTESSCTASTTVHLVPQMSGWRQEDAELPGAARVPDMQNVNRM